MSRQLSFSIDDGRGSVVLRIDPDSVTPAREAKIEALLVAFGDLVTSYNIDTLSLDANRLTKGLMRGRRR